jgi:hypothetical protein
MRAFIAATLFLVLPLASSANAQKEGPPPGGEIEHVGPFTANGQPSKEPVAQLPVLTLAQKKAILSVITREKPKSKAIEAFKSAVGELVPPDVDLRSLPAGALAEAPAARPYRYTLIANQVVLVDPVTMRVVEVINP